MILLFWVGREYDFTERGGTGVIRSDAAFFCISLVIHRLLCYAHIVIAVKPIQGAALVPYLL